MGKDDSFTAAEVAEEAGCSPEYVSRLANDGKVPSYTNSSNRRVFSENSKKIIVERIESGEFKPRSKDK